MKFANSVMLHCSSAAIITCSCFFFFILHHIFSGFLEFSICSPGLFWLSDIFPLIIYTRFSFNSLVNCALLTVEPLLVHWWSKLTTQAEKSPKKGFYKTFLAVKWEMIFNFSHPYFQGNFPVFLWTVAKFEFERVLE